MPLDFERADRIGEFWGHPESRAVAELLIGADLFALGRALFIPRPE
jgi:hypothetical protein